MFQGIVNGHLGSNMVATSTCQGQSGEFFICSGTKKYVILHTSDITTKEFNIQSEVYVEKLDWTAASFTFTTSSNHELNFGLDGSGLRYTLPSSTKFRWISFSLDKVLSYESDEI